MMLQNLLLVSESYTHSDWVYRDVYVGFSRLYYIIDGEAYYEEGGKAVRFKKGFLYLTPVKKRFTLYENPNDKLLHTYAHIITVPAVDRFVEIEVRAGTPLSDAVELWRKYARLGDEELCMNAIRFLLSCLDLQNEKESAATRTRRYIDSLESFSFDMASVSAALGYSREHITRSFLSEYQLTPKQYFNERRMRDALERLQSGARVCEVAEALNYASSYSFSKAFKKQFGLSPEKYLKTLN
ncbi:MAG: helix-turn-helix transcriptional regulator [Clostridia bacterium]|nr:helix-turn-helix transcriptional regulator [Clostridia bacterium]